MFVRIIVSVFLFRFWDPNVPNSFRATTTTRAPHAARIRVAPAGAQRSDVLYPLPHMEAGREHCLRADGLRGAVLLAAEVPRFRGYRKWSDNRIVGMQ